MRGENLGGQKGKEWRESRSEEDEERGGEKLKKKTGKGERKVCKWQVEDRRIEEGDVAKGEKKNRLKEITKEGRRGL